MPFFTRSTRTHHTTGLTTNRPKRRGLFHRRDKDHVAGGYKAALSNPRTTRKGRKHAKHELRAMGRSRDAHVPLMTRIKRTLGIRSTPRAQRHHHTATAPRRSIFGRRRY